MLFPGLCDLSSQAELRKALDRIDTFEALGWLNFHNLKKYDWFDAQRLGVEFHFKGRGMTATTKASVKDTTTW
jgi:hypothetical protein